MICPECGKKLPDDAGFCIRCGANQNNPNAEVYKKTRTIEQSDYIPEKEPTLIDNIIPDETVEVEPEKNDVSEPIIETHEEPEKEELPDNEEEDEEGDKSGKSSRLAVLSVICVILLVACIVVYFFTKNNTFNDSKPESEVTSQSTTVETTLVESATVSETTSEITTKIETEPPQTSIVTDANGNSYDVVLSNDLKGIVKVDEGTLRLRAYPSTDATVLGIMGNGDEVTIKGSYGEWYYIEDGDRVGYAFSEYITIEEIAETTQSTETEISVSEETKVSE